MDLPRATRPWDHDPEALTTVLRANGGGATIFFKNPGAERVLAASGTRGFRAPVGKAAIQDGLQLLRENDVRLGSYLPTLGAVVATVPPGVAPTIGRHPLVDFVEPTGHFKLDGTAGTTAPTATFSQETPWGVQALRASEAWKVTTGTGSKILILDTGHDRGHEDLPLLPVDNCSSGASTACDDPVDHGTGTAGVIAARDNSLGVVGIAPGLTASNTFVWEACPTALCEDSLIAKGLDWAVQNDVDVVNMSFSGTEANMTVAAGVGNAASASIVMVASIGNHCHDGDGSCFPSPNEPEVYPAAYSDVIGVSGVNSNLTFAHSPNPRAPECFAGESSNLSPYVSVSAPWDALTTSSDLFNPYRVYCGTSAAAPHIAGVAAMIRDISPFLPAWQVEVRLEATAKDLGPTGWDDQFGAGLVDAWAAVGPHVSVVGPEFEVPPNTRCEWTASVVGGVDPTSFAWYDDETLIATSSVVELTTGDDGDLLELRFVATDTHFFEDEWSEHIDVTSEAESSPFCGNDDDDGGGQIG